MNKIIIEIKILLNYYKFIKIIKNLYNFIVGNLFIVNYGYIIEFKI